MTQVQGHFDATGRFRADTISIDTVNPDRVGGELDLSPWDALLLEVRRTAYRVAWIDHRIEEILRLERALEASSAEENGDAGGTDGMDEVDPVIRSMSPGALEARLRGWMAESRAERRHLTMTSKRALDAGLAAHVVRASELEARTIARVLARALAPLELNDGQRREVGLALRAALEEVSAERRGRVLEGDHVPGHDDPHGPETPL